MNLDCRNYGVVNLDHENYEAMYVPRLRELWSDRVGGESYVAVNLDCENHEAMNLNCMNCGAMDLDGESYVSPKLDC